MARVLLPSLLALLLLTPVAPAAERDEQKSVLLLYQESKLLPAVTIVDQEIRSTLQSGSAGPIRFYSEYLDASWFPDEKLERELVVFLRHKYASRKLDLVIPAGPLALRFALTHRSTIFPGVPIVFAAGFESMVRAPQLGPDVTGVWLVIDWRANLDLVLQLQPDTRRVAFVYGTSTFERAEQGRFREAFSAYHGRLELTELTDLPVEEVLNKVAALPDQTVVMFYSVLRDATGRSFVPRDVLAQLARESRVPVYGVFNTFIGRGIVGGRAVSFEEQGRRAAALGLRVLRGERPGPAGAVGPEANLHMFDARQLQRWGISEERLPPGSVVEYREPSAWQRYRWYIVGGLAVTGIQALLIVGLLVQRAHRTRAQRALDERLRFERLLSQLSTRFTNLPTSEVDREIEGALGRILEELRIDRGSLIEFMADPRFVRLTHSMTAEGVAPLPTIIEVDRFPWTVAELRRGGVIRVSRLDELPANAVRDREGFLALGTRSLAVVPLAVGQSVTGALGFSSVRAQRDWPDELVQRLRLLGEIFANALMRRRAEGAVRESEERFRLMADSAPFMAWMSGADKLCTYFNRPWLDFTGRSMEQELGAGWAQGVHPDDLKGCLDTYNGAFDARRPFTMEYRLRRFDGEHRWILDHGVPRVGIDGSFIGYIGSCIDITDRQRAEEDARRHREELAHALRVTTMGELAASLAHEINQPLAAIMSNAQAALLLLASSRLGRDELQGALTDIAEDARRAAEVIGRLRALFRKEYAESKPVDINRLITGVASLLRNEVERKGIAMKFSLAAGLPPVLGDAIQLQQVVLNLLVNASEAMAGAVDGPRQLAVETFQREPGTLMISVRDTGIGVKESELERIFEPFVSTKAEGLGMGLSISRSIVDAHGGRIWATRNDDRGITVCIELPCEEEDGTRT